MDITKQEALDMAHSIVNASFFMYRPGCFDLSVEEIANVLMIAFHYDDTEERDRVLKEYNNILSNKAFFYGF